MTDHRELGRSLNGLVWQLLARTDRTATDDARMVDAAHASQYHWREAGGPPATRGEWLISHVYAVLGRPEPALHHARRCLELAEGESGVADFDQASRSGGGVADFDHAYAAEAMARALACAGDQEQAATWHARATAAGAAIADDEDREIFTGDLTAGPWFGLSADAGTPAD
jgi:hypothetical protein